MGLRADNLRQLDGGTFDVVVVGGGINGAVTAAALAARGVSVALVERGDFGSFTSQESSNLVWGGFKYLENYEMKLVWDLCTSRNRMFDSYPTQIRQIDFLATMDETAPHSVALATLGALGYWGIGRFATRPPRRFSAKAIEKAEPIVNTSTSKGGIRYADGYLSDNDARFVWGFIRSALDLGATAANYTELVGASHDGDAWTIDLHDVHDDRAMTLKAKAVVNAAGPFVDGLNEQWDLSTKHRIVYSKGIHLIVPRLTETEQVLAFFDDTGRLFYVIPMANRSVIGTTDTRTTNPVEGALDVDREFLLDQINARLDLPTPLTADDVISERSGVRPLVVRSDGNDMEEVDWTSLSRKHEIETNRAKRVVTIFGGKLTDCINVGEEVADEIAELGISVGEPQPWFGEAGDTERNVFYEAAAKVGLDRAPSIERAATLAEVIWRRHGRHAHRVLRAISEDPAMGEDVIAESDILRAELELMAEREMITQPADFFRRRTKLSLVIGDEALATDPGVADVNKAFGF